MNEIETVNRHRLRAWGIRCCGCLLLFALLAIALCALLLSLLIGRTQAAALGDSARHVALLIDQSRSVVNTPNVQALAREMTLGIIAKLRNIADMDDTIRVVFLGTVANTIITTTNPLDDALDTALPAAFVSGNHLGGTAIAEALLGLIDSGEPLSDVILITDGMPDTAETQTPAGQNAYADRLRYLAARYADESITLSVLLIGETPRNDWLPVWSDVTATASGILIEVPTLDEAQRAVETLPIHSSTEMTAPATSSVVAVTPISNPTSTTAPIATRVSATPAVSNKPTPPANPLVAWLPIFIAAGLAIALIGTIAAIWTFRSTKPVHEEKTGGDAGILDICDPKTGDTQRVELRELALGEVWGIGVSPECKIRLGRETGDEEYAALILTLEGPVIESRGAPLWFEGRQVNRHVLFDGDDVYVNRFVFYYQNFFRRRGTVDLDEEMES